MKKLVSTLLGGLAVFATFSALMIVPSDASARGHSSGARSHSSGARSHSPGAGSHSSGVRSQTFHSGARVGVFIGAPVVTSPWWMYPDPYYAYGPYFPPVVQGQEQSVVYVEQQAPSDVAPSAPLAQQYWYYCEDSKTYYPYVQDCATPWQTVVPYALQ